MSQTDHGKAKRGGPAGLVAIFGGLVALVIVDRFSPIAALVLAAGTIGFAAISMAISIFRK